MKKWLSIHLYPLETQNVFLRRAVRPFLERYVWSDSAARAFFIRNHDEDGDHIRLCLHSPTTAFLPLLNEHFQGRGTWAEKPSEPEHHRWGGAATLEWVEEHFHQSTRVVLDRLNTDLHTYSDALFDALRMHLITVFTAGLQQEQIREYFNRLTQQWIALFFEPEPDNPNWQLDILTHFEQTIAPKRTLWTDIFDNIWKDLQQDKLDKKHPEWLRWLRYNQLITSSLGNDLERLLPTLIHQTNNRLGIRNHDEVYLNFILSKIF